jgi:hypothetical protein
MNRPQKDVLTRVTEVTSGWERLRPGKKFFGMTLDDYKAAVKPFTDACADIAELEKALKHAIDRREIASAPAMLATKRIITSVRGDPEEGENGPLVAAMGYTPDSQRNTGLSRRRKEQPAKEVDSTA